MNDEKLAKAAEVLLDRIIVRAPHAGKEEVESLARVYELLTRHHEPDPKRSPIYVY